MSGIITFDKLALDKSVRTKDDNGYLHVEISPLTRVQVAKYLGREVPNFAELGLEAEKVYNVYRPAEELKKAVDSFNGIPILLHHKEDSAEKPLNDLRVGATGTSAAFDGEYLTNALAIHNAEAIALIESGEQREISAGYYYVPVLESGTFEGEPYSLVMTEIKGNHIALVSEGRAGSSVLVMDGQLNKGADMAVKKRLRSIVGDSLAKLKNALTKDNLADVDKVIKDAEEALLKAVEGEPNEGQTNDSKKDELLSILSALPDEVRERAAELLADFVEGTTDEKPESTTEDEDEDKKEEKDEEKQAQDSKPVFDMKTVIAEATQIAQRNIEERFKRKEKALEAVRSVCGSLQGSAFDSAEEVYRYGLTKCGMAKDEALKIEPSALEQVTKAYIMARAAKSSPTGFTSLAQDSADADLVAKYKLNTIKRS